MVRYSEYFLEYNKGNQIFNLKNPRNGKDVHIDPSARKHATTTPQEYKHKHPLIDNITSNRANNVSIKGLPLTALLKTYNTHFETGVKSLGNSGVEADLYEDEEGIPCATLRRKEKNAV
jgi:hypothetical protein